ncbi:MAG: hypothetical protein ABIS59_02315, partial [Candidatus Saccharibacteria bacterium]
MISPKIQLKRKHYTVGLATIIVALFIGLYLLINQLQSFDTHAVATLPIQFPQLDKFMLAITTI